MKNYSNAIMAAALAIFVSTSALAAISNIKEMKDGSQISVTGLVDKVENEHAFVLRDKTGTIGVDITSDQIIALRQGDTVTVNGILAKDLLKTNINAKVVGVNENVARAVDEKKSIENGTAPQAASYTLDSLPRDGLVQVSGRVTSIDKIAKKFTLKDATGEATVDLASSEKTKLKKGADVTVIGYMDSGAFGRDISANRVLVISSTTASLE